MAVRLVVRWGLVPAVLLACLCHGASLRGDPLSASPSAFPSAAAVAQLLKSEPISSRTWPAWRQRLIAWESDPSESTTPAFDAAVEFMRKQASDGELPARFAQDAFAWYLLGCSLVMEHAGTTKERVAVHALGEKALRRSLLLDPNRGEAHAHLAGALTAKHVASQTSGRPATSGPYLAEAHTELEAAHRLAPNFAALDYLDGALALVEERYRDAEGLLERHMARQPSQEGARLLARTLVLLPDPTENRSTRVGALIEKYPTDGVLVSFHALALSQDGDPHGAIRELDRALTLGTDPARVISAPLVAELRDGIVHYWLRRADVVFRGFVAFYAGVLVLMMSTGLLLAFWTRGTGALKLLGNEAEEWVTAGRVIRTGSESLLSRLYQYALGLSLVLFYAAFPFVTVGVVGLWAMFIFAILKLDPVPVKPLALTLFIGAVITWGLIKSLLVRPGGRVFGLRKTADDCPRLYRMLLEVAERVDTEPISDVYLMPGAGVGVHQRGSGPFGAFGEKRRVLVIGFSTINCLTVAQLRAVLAHEYAHFSHHDTYYNRFVFQVLLTMDQAILGLGNAGRLFKYTNPFFWFLFVYRKSFHLLASGFSRSREFLADRMAASLYGSAELTTALRAVMTEGSLFELCLGKTIAAVIDRRQGYVRNRYETASPNYSNWLRCLRFMKWFRSVEAWTLTRHRLNG